MMTPTFFVKIDKIANNARQQVINELNDLGTIYCNFSVKLFTDENEKEYQTIIKIANGMVYLEDDNTIELIELSFDELYDIAKNITIRDWTCIKDNDELEFGLRYKYTRKQWIEQAVEWLPNYDEDELYKELHSMNDDELMSYIAETFSLEIIETTHIYVGNVVQWGKECGETPMEIKEIFVANHKVDDIVIANMNGDEYHVKLKDLYGYANVRCPKCSELLYVSDVVGYPYVCLNCDENFHECEI